MFFLASSESDMTVSWTSLDLMTGELNAFSAAWLSEKMNIVLFFVFDEHIILEHSLMAKTSAWKMDE